MFCIDVGFVFESNKVTEDAMVMKGRFVNFELCISKVLPGAAYMTATQFLAAHNESVINGAMHDRLVCLQSIV